MIFPATLLEIFIRPSRLCLVMVQIPLADSDQNNSFDNKYLHVC
jgi:hypothetical protein